MTAFKNGKRSSAQSAYIKNRTIEKTVLFLFIAWIECLMHCVCAALHKMKQLGNKLFRRHAVFIEHPSFHGADNDIDKKVKREFIVRNVPNQLGQPQFQNGPDILPKML